MALAHGTVKHFGLHRLEGVELRVIADEEAGILRIEQAEIDVVARLSSDARWQHKSVTLFVLSDLQPLQRQLDALGRVPADVRLQQREELLSRPVVNVYDLASPLTCNVFANRQAMVKAQYWDDALALTGLLAHEHAHPLSECPYTTALRRLRISLNLHLREPWAPDAALAKNWMQRAEQQILALAVQLFSSGPREVFTNTIAAEADFDAALVHLNRQNIANLAAGLQYRPMLAAQLAQAVAGGQLSSTGADMLRLIGDMQAFLPLAMEIAPLRRAGRAAKARTLLKPLHEKLLPHLERPVAPLFDDLAGQYARLNESAAPQEVQCDAEHGLERLARACAEVGATLDYRVEQVQAGR